MGNFKKCKIWCNDERDFLDVLKKAEELGYAGVQSKLELGFDFYNKGYGGGLFMEESGHIGWQTDVNYFDFDTDGYSELSVSEFVSDEKSRIVFEV